jgi:hypothetical protein
MLCDREKLLMSRKCALKFANKGTIPIVYIIEGRVTSPRIQVRARLVTMSNLGNTNK